MKKIIVFAITCIMSAALWAQASLNMTLVGQLSYPGNELANLWGYVAPDGTEYAIIGTEFGVSIVSLADPSNPTEVQFLPGIQTIWREVKTFDHYAYISNEGGDGLRIIDLANLPGTVTYKDTVIHGIVTSHTVSEADGYLYVNGTNVGNGGLQIFNLNNNPWKPQFVGEYTQRYVHDCYIRNDTVYAGEINDGLLTIIDVKNKANPIVLGTHSYTNSFTHNTWLNTKGDVCFTTDEKDAAYVYAWDITDPTNIIERDRIRGSLSGGASIPHNIHVINDFGVTSYYKDGVMIFDVSHPSNMIETAYYDTSPQSGGGFAGCWGVYPYLPSGLIIASDIELGLFVLQPQYVRGCYLEGLITDATTNQPIQGATIAFSTVSDASINNGTYESGIATAGTYQVTYSKAGYLPQTFSLSLQNGVTLTKDVQLVPNAPVSVGISVLESATGNAPINAAVIFATDNNGLNYNFTTNAIGSTNNVISGGTYTVTVGKWGYKTKQVTLNTQSSQNLTIYLDKGYYDDFFFNFGWTQSGTAPRGNWERGEPVGTTAQGTNGNINPDADVVTDFGDKAFVTGNDGGNVGDDDVDAGYTLLTSPVFDLTGYTNPTITYNWWMANVDLANQGAINDHFKIELSNGTQTVNVKDYTGMNNSWKSDSILISNFLAPTATMRILLRVEDAQPGHILEGAFDKFQVKGAVINGIDAEIARNFSASLFPNPTNGTVTLTYRLKDLTGDIAFVLYDLQGAKIQTLTLTGTEGTETLSLGVAAGVYLGVWEVNGNKIKTEKISVK